MWSLLFGSKGCPRHCVPCEHAHEGFLHQLLPLPTLQPVWWKSIKLSSRPVSAHAAFFGATPMTLLKACAIDNPGAMCRHGGCGKIAYLLPAFIKAHSFAPACWRS